MEEKKHKEIVGDYMQTHVPVVRASLTVGEVRRMITQEKTPWDSINYIYVVDGEKRLTGAVSVKELFTTDAAKKIGSVMVTHPVSVRVHTDRERAAELAIAHSLKSVPVVDPEHHFLGIVPSDEILRILHEEHIEDFLKFGGIVAPRGMLDILKARFRTLFFARVGWLSFGVLGGFFGAFVLGAFEGILEQELALAFFLPLVLYLAAAVGSQTQTLYIRTLALQREIAMRRYVFREVVLGLLLGLFFSVIVGGIVSLWSGGTILPFILGFSVLTTVLSSVLLSLCIPWILVRTGRDPAVGTGPFANVLQDVLSTVLYLTIASFLLSI